MKTKTPTKLKTLRNSIQRHKTTKQKEREEASKELTEKRNRALEKWYAEGGELFFRWAKKYYRIYTGEKLRWDEPFLPEFFILLGCPWVEREVVEKGGQMGFSEALG